MNSFKFKFIWRKKLKFDFDIPSSHTVWECVYIPGRHQSEYQSSRNPDC